MKFLVLEPDGKAHEFYITRDKLGQEILDKVCDKLNIKEKSYFGLRYTVNDTNLWLNLRNPVLTQLRPHLVPGKPHRLRLEVKFFVSPQEIQQEETRHQFYLCLRKQIGEGKFNLNQDEAALLCALLAQADYGHIPFHYPHALVIPPPWPREHIERKVWEEHVKRNSMSPKAARDDFLIFMAKKELYNAEIFKAKTGGSKIYVSVGSAGLKVFERKIDGKVKQIIGFEEIIKINLFEERLILVLKREDVHTKHKFMHFFLVNSEAAKAMHKAVLEHQLFFYSSKVRQSVLDHYLLSMPCWALPAKWFTKIPARDLYHLDVKCTRRQSYDQHYRAIHQVPGSEEEYPLWLQSCAKCGTGEANTIFSPCGHIVDCTECAAQSATCSVCKQRVVTCQKVYYVANLAENDWTCQVCMDSKISTVFCPCGHICCCEECAQQLSYCPMCKTFITFVQRVCERFPEPNQESCTPVAAPAQWHKTVACS